MLRWHLEPPRREATPPWVGKEQKPISSERGEEKRSN